MTELTAYLRATEFIESDHPAVAAYVERHGDRSQTLREQMVRLYYAVRDGWRYNPWNVAHTREGFLTSTVLLRDRKLGGHCIDKANVLAACARHLGVPSRLHFANVRNHIGTEELERQLGTDLLVFHGYVELWLEDRWVAATPAFNRELCDHLGVDPLEFDGRHDSIFQPYDRHHTRFMEYVHDHGSFADIPFDAMIAEWKRYYPKFGQLQVWPKPARHA